MTTTWFHKTTGAYLGHYTGPPEDNPLAGHTEMPGRYNAGYRLEAGQVVPLPPAETVEALADAEIVEVRRMLAERPGRAGA